MSIAEALQTTRATAAADHQHHLQTLQSATRPATVYKLLQETQLRWADPDAAAVETQMNCINQRNKIRHQ